MEKNKQQNNSAAAGENSHDNASGKEELRGANSKTSLSGQSMIEENNAENTQGSGLTAGTVVGGVEPNAEGKPGEGGSGSTEENKGK